jgi:hypothetical protein
VIVSGAAVVLHGHAREVVDLDLVPAPDPDTLRRASHCLARLGFVASLPLPLAAVVVARLFDATMREVDVFVRYRIGFDALWRDSREVELGATRGRIMSLPHLLQAERDTARPHDLRDGAALADIAARGRDTDRAPLS